MLRASVLSHLQRHPESLLVIEEYDKADCASRALLRQVLDRGAVGNSSSAARSIVVLEANAGSLEMYKMLHAAESREALSPETAQRALKDIIYQRWVGEACEEAIDTQKLLSLVDAFVPFLPLERRHVREVIEALLRDRRTAGIRAAEFAALHWDDAVLELLTDKCEFEVGRNGTVLYATEGAKQGRIILSRHANAALRSLPPAPGAAVRLRATRAGGIFAERAA